VLLGIGAAAEGDLASRKSHHDAVDGEHEHDDFESFVVALPEIETPEVLVAGLRRVAEAHDVLRMKGFASVRGKRMRLLVQGVGGRFRQEFDRAWRDGEAREGGVVVIGRTGMDRVAIEAAVGAAASG
jgi:cobalamin biosynthesis protein CobW